MPAMNDPDEEVIFRADDDEDGNEIVSFSDRLSYLYEPADKSEAVEAKKEDVLELKTENIADIEDDEEDDEPVRINSVFNIEDLRDDIKMKTKQVAELCGVTSQTVRNYMAIWDARIKVPRSEKGDMIFGKRHAKMFQEMLLVKENDGNSRTVQGTLDYFMKPTPEMLSENGEAAPATQEFLERMISNITNVVDLRMKQYQDSINNALEDKQTNSQELQREIAEKQSHTDEVMQEILNTVNALKKRDEEREKELRALREENTELKNKINEEPPKKKFLGIF